MPQINSAGVSVVKAILRALARPRYVLMALALAAVTLVAVLALQSCRSSVPIIIRNEQYQCQIEIRNNKGTTNFQDCIRTDGHDTDVDAPGGAGDDDLHLNIDPPESSALDGASMSLARWVLVPIGFEARLAN